MLKAVRRIPCLILAVIDVIGPGIYGGKLHGPTVLLQAQQGGIVTRQQQARCANAAIKIEQASGAGVLVTRRRAVSQKNALCRMRFVDEARIQVRAGKGGHGCLSFRREKFVPRGGPDGGNGGDGGSVLLKADGRLLSLYDFRLKRLYEARNGRPGEGSQCDGKKGEDMVLHLPVGTLVFAEGPNGEELLADLSDPDTEVLVARGGRGGKGNEHFKSATMGMPCLTEKARAALTTVCASARVRSPGSCLMGGEA